jgi:hypothetical protein
VSEVLQADLVVGVDTHLDTHTAAICNARGRVVSQTADTRHHGGVRAAAGLGPVSRRGPPGGLGR